MRKNIGRQYVSLNETSCKDRRTILHEIGHLIGLHHEYERPDRDKYFKILTSNLKPDYSNQFEKLNKKNLNFLLPYDYQSIMGPDNIYSINRKNTIKILKQIRQKYNGKLQYLSKLNIYEVNQLYNCH